MTRAERQKLYGGSTMGGIQPSAKTLNVFLYSDPAEAVKNGYTFDGWAKDGDVYLYTGDGKLGDQTWTTGNVAIRDHQSDGRSLRLFKTTGRELKPGGKIHYYVGEFVVDADNPFVAVQASDANKENRSVFVFRLKPVGTVSRRSGDEAATGDVSALPDSEMVSVEQANADEFPVAPTSGGTAKRRETELTTRYRIWLETQGHEVKRWRVRLPGELRSLYTDIYDVTEKELYEAKGSIKRSDIRMAIGQLLDYSHNIDAVVPKLTVLLPERPPEGLLSLLDKCGMSCVFATGPDTFERADS
jgi:5-methylcytosine-specific restriction protein A